MPQLHLYVPDETAYILKRRAEERGVSLSKYLADVVGGSVDAEGWPPGFFEEVIGGWSGDLKRVPEGVYEERDSFPETAP